MEIAQTGMLLLVATSYVSQKKQKQKQKQKTKHFGLTASINRNK
jgi:hypothetical protein